MRIFQKGFNFSQDGPGNRLVYHLQGCNLRCPWCSNPEGLSIHGGEEYTVDALVEELDTEFSPERRKELTTQIQREVLADAAFVVIGHSNFICVRKADIQGFFINPSEYYVLDGNIRRGR